MKEAVLALHNIKKNFIQAGHDIELLKNISISFMQGTSYAIMGISGSGKSTLLNIIAGFENPTSGGLLFNHNNVYHFSQEERYMFTRDHIGIIFQQPYLMRELTVLENIMVKIYINKLFYTTERAWSLLEKVGLADKAYQLPSVLSGGEQQRVALVRALIHEPTFLLADEPTAHLDKENKERLIVLLQEAVRSGTGLIITTHDSSLIHHFQQILHLEHGYLYE